MKKKEENYLIMNIAEALAAYIDRAVKTGVQEELNRIFKESAQPSLPCDGHTDDSPRYVIGLRGIADLFKVSEQTARKFRHTWLKPAIRENHNRIICDRELALKLYHENYISHHE